MIEPSDRARLLIIDDEEIVRKVLLRLLSGSHACQTAGSAEEALSLMEHERFDLVLSDIRMGGRSGLEMIPELRALAPDTVVMMISGEQSIDSAIEAMRLGAFDYIQKPFNPGHVIAAVNRALDYQSLLVTKRHYESHLEELVVQRTRELEYLAYHDALTDLPNCALFEDRLDQALAAARRSGSFLAVLVLSPDRFKQVGETLGRESAGRLLQEIAKRLSRTMREGDTVARFEGDEFAVVLTQVADASDVIEIVHRIGEALKRPFFANDHELFVTASIGISVYPEDGSDSRDLMKNAGSALQRAKEHGGDSHQFYAADMNDRALHRLKLETSLRRAVERREFEVHYQPQVNIITKEVVGMEALVRWRHPERGLLFPADFIDLAEDTGLIVPIGEWVLETACRQIKAWQDDGLHTVPVAVNFSARQVQQQNLAAWIIHMVEETGLDPRSLEFELTESSLMKNPDAGVRTLAGLRKAGVSISIDDFGTGYSNLGYLKKLPIDVLKIDRSFVRDLATNPDDAAVVMAIVTLAHSLGLRVIAEGIETEEQLRFLHLLKCEGGQGYLFGRPVPSDVFRPHLRNGRLV